MRRRTTGGACGSGLRAAGVLMQTIEGPRWADAGAYVVVVGAAQGHSRKVVEMVRRLKRQWDGEVIAGNIATAEATEALIEAGADAIQAGVGPGASATTRGAAG